MTAQGKKTTASLSAGDHILITSDPGRAPTRTVGDWHPNRVKTGATAANVLRKDAVSGRRIRYDVVTDVGTVPSVTGAQTFLLAAQTPSADAVATKRGRGAR